MEILIDGEKAYPIYSINARWSQEGDQSTYSPAWYEGLPEGRIWNGTGFKKMFKEEQTEESLNKFLNDWWEKYIKDEIDSMQIVNLVLEKLEITFYENETWFLTWFSHETFDNGQTDEEALQSFKKYVTRKEELNYKSQQEKGEDVCCLMGAEDRWRWRGADANGEYSEDSPAPCRCKFCKEQGVLRIAH
jgi:hypothetical protein